MIDNPIDGEQSNHRISNIYQISSLLTEPSLVGKALTSVMETVKYNLGYERCSLTRKICLECKFITGFIPEQENIARSKPFKLPKHDCLETRVALLGKPLLIKDHPDPNITKIDKIVIANMERKGSTLYVPLKVKGEVIGVLGVNRKQGEAVRSVVVHNQMNLQIGRYIGVHRLKETEIFLMAMSALAGG